MVGHVLRWERIERAELVEASIAAYHGDRQPLLLYRSLDSVSFAAAVIKRLSDGENPVRVCREYYDLTQEELGTKVGGPEPISVPSNVVRARCQKSWRRKLRLFSMLMRMNWSLGRKSDLTF